MLEPLPNCNEKIAQCSVDRAVFIGEVPNSWSRSNFEQTRDITNIISLKD